MSDETRRHEHGSGKNRDELLGEPPGISLKEECLFGGERLAVYGVASPTRAVMELNPDNLLLVAVTGPPWWS